VIHHVSFCAKAPAVAARGLAWLLGAQAIKAPSPPFPTGAWFVCLGDAHGTLLEVLPWGSVLAPGLPGGKGVDEAMREHTATHVLLTTPRATDQIERIATEEGWRWSHADAGLFSFTKVWVEETFLVELMTPEQSNAYVAVFGRSGAATIDSRMRGLERALLERA
jgi:hypothetical protein